MAASGEVKLLVIDYTTNWYQIFKGARTTKGSRIVVEQAEWKDIHVEASSTTGATVFLKASDNPLPFSTQKTDRTLQPDFLLVRNFPSDIHDNSFRNIVVGLLFANIPSLLPSPSYPAVIKVSSTHAGYGKIQATDDVSLKDIRCVLALHNDYYTAEPLIDYEYEFRIQKIGERYRAFRRNSSSHWKNNWGNLTFVDHEWREEYKVWADAAATVFGEQLDILALDVLHKADGTDVIIELNDTAPGLMYDHEQEDLQAIRDVVLKRMDEHGL